MKGMRSPRLLRRLGPLRGRWAGAFMFPDLARDDVFRLETAKALAALAARVRRPGDPSLLLPMGGCALYRPHPHPYPPGLG